MSLRPWLAGQRHSSILLRPKIGHATAYQRFIISKGRRQASTDAAPPSTRLRNLLYGSGSLLAIASGYLYMTDTRSSVHQYIIPPLTRALYQDAEVAHHFGTKALRELYTLGLHPRERDVGLADGKLAVEVLGQSLANPIGISGGLDKGGEIPDPLFAIGSSVVEIGGVTPLPQPGNAKPRVFRLESQNAIINRYGLNSEGADIVAMRLRQRVREFAYRKGYGIDEVAEDLVLNGGAGVPPGSLMEGKLLAVQIAKNKATPDKDLTAVVRDHVVCVEKLGKYADLITVNVSSPNTPGLRSLQSKGPLTQILSAVVNTANNIDRRMKPIVMVKISPDEDSETQIRNICDAVWESGVAGVIVGNTTLKRPDPLPHGYILPDHEARNRLETGGYSGPQLFQQTKSLVSRYRKILDDGPSDDPRSSPSSPALATTESSNHNVSHSDQNSPLLQLPERHSSPSSPSTEVSSAPSPQALSTQSATNAQLGRSTAFDSPQKLIFASGGITNGAQALEVLNAGASVAMIYTALTYGGLGTITRVKREMVEEIERSARR